MRGKLTDELAERMATRITPAHAGKTSLSFQIALPTSDHPRACGENPSLCRFPAPQAGSPPRMRGKHSAALPPPESARITPAHAGKTLSKITITVLYTDHPRACGENVLAVPLFDSVSGSPPRMRGKLTSISDITATSRITPAHAGKTFSRSPGDSAGSDHPRACGENLAELRCRYFQVGSPPRMRGKQRI